MSCRTQVAILCNHQRSVPKTHTATIEKLQASAWAPCDGPIASPAVQHPSLQARPTGTLLGGHTR